MRFKRAQKKTKTTPLRYAVVTGRAGRDPTVDLRGALGSVARRNRPAIVGPSRLGELMRAIAGYRGDISTEFALRLQPLTRSQRARSNRRYHLERWVGSISILGRCSGLSDLLLSVSVECRVVRDDAVRPR